MSAPELERHLEEIRENRIAWENKPRLREVYKAFHGEIGKRLADRPGPTVELGSGIGAIKETLPDCVTTDLFENPGVDRMETAYSLGFADESVANLILFDVFHHLHYPGTAFREFFRVLVPGGRVLIFDPYAGLFGRMVYGLFHHEPVAFKDCSEWTAPAEWNPADDRYFAAQGRAVMAFWRKPRAIEGFRIFSRSRFAAFSYLATGGFRGRSLAPDFAFPLLRGLDRILPSFCAVRCLVVLEKETR